MCVMKMVQKTLSLPFVRISRLEFLGIIKFAVSDFKLSNNRACSETVFHEK